MRTLTVFVFVVLLTSFSPRGHTDDFSDDSDDSDDDWGDDDWDDDEGGYDSEDDDAWEDDDWDDDSWDDESDDESSSSSGISCGDYPMREDNDDPYENDPHYDADEDTYDDDYDGYDDYGGEGFGCSGPYLHHDSCKERCGDRYDECMSTHGSCQDWDAAVFDGGSCPDCSIEHQKCVELC